MDKINLYNENRESVKTYVFDKTNIPYNLYYNTVHIWIHNLKYEFLIQKRAKFVKNLPQKWTVTSGTVLYCESNKMAAKREVKEELGLELDMENLDLIFQYKKKQHFVDVYKIELDFELNDLKLQEGEVEDAMFASMKTIKNMIEEKDFYSYCYFSFLWEMLKSK